MWWCRCPGLLNALLHMQHLYNFSPLDGGGCALCSEGSWVPIEHIVAWAEANLHTKCHLSPSIYYFACCHVCTLLLFYVLLYYHNCSHTNTVQVNNSLKYTVWVLASLHDLSHKTVAKWFSAVFCCCWCRTKPTVSILRITVCTILDNDDIPTSDDSADLLDFSNYVYF